MTHRRAAQPQAVLPGLVAPGSSRSARSQSKADSMADVLRGGVIFAVVAGLAGFIIVAIAGGRDGMVNGIFGATTAIAVYLMGYYLMRWLMAAMPTIVVGVALCVYFLQTYALWIALNVASGASWFDGKLSGGVIVVTVIGWIAGMVWGAMRSRAPIVDVAMPGSGTTPTAAPEKAAA